MKEIKTSSQENNFFVFGGGGGWAFQFGNQSKAFWNLGWIKAVNWLEQS
jgi:hypothetical protein